MASALVAVTESAVKCSQSSATISRCRSTRRIDALLERAHADAAIGVYEALALVAPLAIDIDDALYGIGHGALRHGGTDHLAQCGEAVHRAAEGDLIPLLAVLLDAENPDVSDVMMAAGIHAAGHLDFDFPKIVEIVEIIKALLNIRRDTDRAGVGETAEIKPGAGNHVRQHADVGGRKLLATQREPRRV